MRKLIIAILLFSAIAFAREGDPGLSTDVETLKIPSSVDIKSTGTADRIEIYGLPKGSEIIDLPRGWRVVRQQGDMTALQGPSTNQPTAIKFTSPGPGWEASVVGFKGRNSIWTVGHVTSTSQHQQTDINVLEVRAEGSSGKLLLNNKGGGFTCPDGTELSCLGSGDNVCPGSTKCVAEKATCFDSYPCNPNDGFVCDSKYDELANDYRNTVRKYNDLSSENVNLRERRLEQKNCVANASTLKQAKKCVR